MLEGNVSPVGATGELVHVVQKEDGPVKYHELTFKVPQESPDYPECSEFVIAQIEAILRKVLASGKNTIIINTNLRLDSRWKT